MKGLISFICVSPTLRRSMRNVRLRSFLKISQTNRRSWAFLSEKEYNLKGIHLNRRNPEPPACYSGHISCSCHSLEEVKQYKPGCDYVFLSPIFDSISKQDYKSGYTAEEIRSAVKNGIIDRRVIALGGIDENNLLRVKDFGFGGAAIMGTLWNKFDPAYDYNYQELIAHFRKLKRLAD